jgi:hypothetical protein
MNRRTFSFVSGILFVILPALATSPRVLGDDLPGTKKVPWKISGQLEEACSCSAACPCWFGSMPTRMNCAGTQVIFIDKGHFGSVRLDGLAMAHFTQSPDNQTMMESFGKWNISYLYIDEKATPKQREALETVGKIVLPYEGSATTKIQYVPITRVISGKENKITVGGYGTIEGHLIEGGLGGHPKIVNPPGADPVHHEYFQGATTKLTYNDADQNWNWKNTNYMRGEFTVDSDEYEKYTAGLAQKMAEMKKTTEPTK